MNDICTFYVENAPKISGTESSTAFQVTTIHKAQKIK